MSTSIPADIRPAKWRHDSRAPRDSEFEVRVRDRAARSTNGRRRLFAAAEAKAAGHGGIAAVSRIAASTIGRGLKELKAPEPLKSLTETDSRLRDDRNALVEPDARGDPMPPLRWTCKSLRRLATDGTSSGTRSATRSLANC